MITFNAESEQKLFDLLIKNNINFSKINELLRKKDIKVNGEKISENILLKKGDKIEIFAYLDFLFKIKKVYEDENVIIVDKPKKIEVCGESLFNLETVLKAIAVHRLDFNTEGLVILAKNQVSKIALDYAFSHHLVDKTYITLALGNFNNKEYKLVDFLEKKDGYVKVYKEEIANSVEIKTNFNVLEKKPITNNELVNLSLKEVALLKVNLLTGKTHQIRAHLSFNGFKILGDCKYGNFIANKIFKQQTQVLKCIELKFNLPQDNPLCYLNEKTFALDFDNIKNLYNSIENN